MGACGIFNLISEVHGQYGSEDISVDLAHFELVSDEEFVLIEKSGLCRLNLKDIKEKRNNIQESMANQDTLKNDPCLTETLEALKVAEALLIDLTEGYTTEEALNAQLKTESQTFFDKYFKDMRVICKHNSGTMDNPVAQVKRALHL